MAPDADGCAPRSGHRETTVTCPMRTVLDPCLSDRPGVLCLACTLVELDEIVAAKMAASPKRKRADISEFKARTAGQANRRIHWRRARDY
jgi:hypothetical protein